MHSYFRVSAGNFTTIPQYFKEHGYTTAGIGKIFHHGEASNYDDPISWTEPYYHGHSYNWSSESSVTWTAAGEDKVKKYPLEDQRSTQYAIESLKKYAPAALSGEKPFFLALGFIRPHLPFLSPAHFFDYYPMEDIRLPSNPYAPVGMPPIAWSDFDEMWDYKDVQMNYGYNNINFTYPDWFVRNLRRAYYASITYVDSLVGEVIESLDDLGLTDSTVVSFWGDHGWQLGEHAEWCKHTNFDIATHAPMMVHVPQKTDNGVVTENLVEFVDIFPTVVEAANLPKIPLCPEDSSNVLTCTEGVSLLPLIQDPKQQWKSGSFSQWPRMDGSGNTIMGYTMRTDRYRYTEWVYYNNTAFSPRWDLMFKGAVELYDHLEDPEENINMAKNTTYADVRKSLSRKLHNGWRAAMPPSAS